MPLYPGGKGGHRRRPRAPHLLPLALLSLSRDPPRPPQPPSSPSISPLIPASPMQAATATSSASPSCTSPAQESARDRRSRPLRVVPFRLRAATTERARLHFPATTDLLQPHRASSTVQGESAYLLDTPSLRLPLCGLAFVRAAARPRHGHAMPRTHGSPWTLLSASAHSPGCGSRSLTLCTPTLAPSRARSLQPCGTAPRSPRRHEPVLALTRTRACSTCRPGPGLPCALGRPRAGRLGHCPGLRPSLGRPKAGAIGHLPGLSPGLAGLRPACLVLFSLFFLELKSSLNYVISF